MKRIATLMLGAALLAAGCIELPIRMDAKPQPSAESTASRSTTEPSVTPQQVNEDNAPKVLKSLREELDRAAERPQAMEPKP